MTIRLDLAGVQPGSRVLDVAAGTGESTLTTASVSAQRHVLASGCFRQHLKRCGRGSTQGRPHASNRVYECKYLELDTDSFDGVICGLLSCCSR
jgi:ubiquinone/menaquinone biosynthesis C-methylase UbiE